MTIDSLGMVGIGDLVEYDNNARTHSDEQVKQIAASIEEFGFTNPLLIDESKRIIAGHGRLEAAKLLGMGEVPTITLVGLTDTQQQAYVIADNQLALNAGWDIDLLSIELDDLVAQGFDIELLGLDDDLVADLFKEGPVDGLTDDDETPEPPDDPVTVEGDVWILGNHRLMCGDSTSVDAVERLMDGHKADMVFTDPPYGMFLDTDYDGMFSGDKRHNKTGDRYSRVRGDHDDFSPDLITTCLEVFDYCREIFMWGADYYSELLTNRNSGSWVVWDKRTNENMDKVVGNTFELCWSKSKHKRMVARILWSGHHGMAKDDTKTRVHPTQKPVELVQWFFDYYSLKNAVNVVDLFGGSGSTLIACEKTNRNCYMMELEPAYCDVIINRWQDYTGRSAVHENGTPYQKGEAA